MRITNKLGLPDAIVEAVRNDPYNPGWGDITVSQLIAPPRQQALIGQHVAELEEDASDRIWSLLGQTVHSILERAEPSALVEQRLYADFAGWKVSGQFDRLHVRDGVLQDYKTSSVWSTLRGAKVEWIAQLNILAELCEVNGYGIRRTEVVAIYRDWSKREAERSADYPKAQVAVVEIPLWARDVRVAYIEERVKLHREARDGTLPECSTDERWLRDEKWAVMKPGNQKATALWLTPEEARADAEAREAASIQARKPARFVVEHRPGENTRCESYCSAVRWCEQARQLGVKAAQPAAVAA